MVAVLILAAGLTVVGEKPASAAPADWGELVDAFALGGTVTLDDDITRVDAQLSVTPGFPVILDLNGHNLSISTSGFSQSAINVPPGATFTVTDSLGSGKVTAASTHGTGGGAGIGGNGFQGSGEITISGGSVEAHGGASSAGIGGGAASMNGTITVSGGSVTAVGGAGGAGIGSGLTSPGGVSQRSGPIQITGGTINATGGLLGAGIGGGQAVLNGVITISAVWLLPARPTAGLQSAADTCLTSQTATSPRAGR